MKLMFHERTRLAQKYSYIKHHNTQHNDTITDNTESMVTKRPLFQGHVLFLTPKFPSARFFNLYRFPGFGHFLFLNTFENYNGTKKQKKSIFETIHN